MDCNHRGLPDKWDLCTQSQWNSMVPTFFSGGWIGVIFVGIIKQYVKNNNLQITLRRILFSLTPRGLRILQILTFRCRSLILTNFGSHQRKKWQVQWLLLLGSPSGFLSVKQFLLWTLISQLPCLIPVNLSMNGQENMHFDFTVW